MQIISKTKNTSSHWYERSEFTQMGSMMYSALLNSFSGYPPLKLVLLVAGMTILSLPTQAGEKETVCNVLDKKTAATNVIYQPGMDVNGEPVAPADIQPEIVGDVINMIKVPLTQNLAQRVAALQGMGIEANAQLGMIEVHENGQVKYQGEDWTKSVNTLCGHSYKEVTVDLVQPEAPVMPVLEEVMKPLTNKLAVASPTEAIERPSVSAPIMEIVKAPTVSQPPEPIKTLIGTPKMKQASVDTGTTDIIIGEDFRDYNE